MLALATIPAISAAQSRRLDLSDSARGAPQAGYRAPVPEPGRTAPRAPVASLRTATPAPASAAETGFGNAFVRDQAVLGMLVYGPSFALSVTHDAIPAIATYLVVSAGSYFVASQLSRDLAISGTASSLATMSALHGALAGWAVAQSVRVGQQRAAGSVFLGSVGATAAVLSFGRDLNEGEASATLFGAQFLAASAFGLASSGGDRQANAAAVAAGLVGVPLGYWYAHRASYHVTSGDVTTLWTSAAIGAVAAGTAVANGHPSRSAVASTLVGGAVVGAIAGDRLLVRRFDHSTGEGQWVALGATGGGLMGAGLGMLVGMARDRVSPATAAFSAAGAIGGAALVERYLDARGAAGRRLSLVEFTPAALVGVVSKQPGTYSLLRWTF